MVPGCVFKWGLGVFTRRSSSFLARSSSSKSNNAALLSFSLFLFPSLCVGFRVLLSPSFFLFPFGEREREREKKKREKKAEESCGHVLAKIENVSQSRVSIAQRRARARIGDERRWGQLQSRRTRGGECDEFDEVRTFACASFEREADLFFLRALLKKREQNRGSGIRRDGFGWKARAKSIRSRE